MIGPLVVLANCVHQDTERTVMDKMDFSFHGLVKGLCFALDFFYPPCPTSQNKMNMNLSLRDSFILPDLYLNPSDIFLKALRKIDH